MILSYLKKQQMIKENRIEELVLRIIEGKEQKKGMFGSVVEGRGHANDECALECMKLWVTVMFIIISQHILKNRKKLERVG